MQFRETDRLAQIATLEKKWIKTRMGWVQVEDGKIPTCHGAFNLRNYQPETIQRWYDQAKERI